MQAEREKRGSIFQLEGEKQSAINVAEGEKQMVVLESERVARLNQSVLLQMQRQMV